MIIQVEMLAFMGEDIFRPVEIEQADIDALANRDYLLELVFRNGQNDFKPSLDHYSVSAGDVIFLDGKKILIKGTGFKELSEEEYKNYRAMPMRDRSFAATLM